MPFRIIRDDITKVKADAIVNPANPEPVIGGGVESAIYEAAGKEKLLEARKELGRLQPGKVGVTEAFNLAAKYIIHVSGLYWKGGNSFEARCLKECYEKALKAALDKGCKSIAFPLLGTGTYGFPKDIGLDVAVSTFTEFLEEYEMEITLVVFDNEAVNVSGKLAYEVKSFIDDKYAHEVLETEYKKDRNIERYALPNERFHLLLKEETYDVPDNTCTKETFSAEPSGSLEAALKNIYKESFEKHLQQLINKKGLKNSEVYAAANISKQYFSKLLKGQVKPSKDKMLALAVGLRLNMDETADFLRIGGYALSPISQTDTVVEYFIRKQEYNVLKINIVLFDYGLEPLSNG
ncbi:macro domain-containing protein [Catonella massiliensis]|uniref:Macro domain-containing protein n=1 Tax=Catonella massiliensis TaxID=2799636 RepID=A0ABS1J2B6_9FIRM|nr:macro domain-containing protein [Catonella massiliensis]MBK5898284.1 macro domain-containing protein [Catonella massiliensis]